MIPKRIFTIWLNKNSYIPEMIQRCIKSRQLNGYKHRFITLDNCFKGNKYIQDSINANLYEREKPRWAETVDYLRLYYLYTEGGIYLDTDIEILPNKTFDDKLNDEMFVGWNQTWVSNNVIGVDKGHPKLKEFMDEVEKTWKGNEEDLIAKVNIQWSIRCQEWNKENPNIIIYPGDVFTSYYTDQNNITENTVTFHYFMQSWIGVYPDWTESNVAMKFYGEENAILK